MVSPTRRWAALAVGTLFVTISFWSMAYGLAVAVAGTPADPARDTTMVAASGIALSVLLLPAGLAAVAILSRRPDWPIAVLAGMGLAIGVGLPLLWFGNPLAALISGYAAAAVVSVSLPPQATWHARAIGAAVVAVVVLVGMATVFALTAIIAPALPFTATAIADRFQERLAVSSIGPLEGSG